MINEPDKSFLRLIARSPDQGDGWRTVSEVCWPLVEKFSTPALIEIDKEGMRVRLTSDGEALVMYAL